MEFWGIELKPKQTVKVEARDDYFLHLSQGALGENPTIDDHATVHVNLGSKKLAIGTLSSRTRMITLDLIFDRDFEFSNSSSENSVFLTGSWVFQPAEGVEHSKTGEKRDKAKVADEKGDEAKVAGEKGDKEKVADEKGDKAKDAGVNSRKAKAARLMTEQNEGSVSKGRDLKRPRKFFTGF